MKTSVIVLIRSSIHVIMEQEQSLLTYLYKENPKLIRDDLKEGQNTKARKLEERSGSTYTGYWDPPVYIGEWKDFDFATLKSIYRGKLFQLLNQNLPCKDFSGIPSWPFCHVADEDSIETLLCKWTQSTVSEALSNAQDHLYKELNSQTIYMARGGQGHCEPAKTSKKEKWFPDWAGIQPFQLSPSKNLPENILLGATEVSNKWHSQSIQTGCVEFTRVKGTWMEPISQVQTYCVNCGTRYGYIITDQELVVLRVQKMRSKEVSGWIRRHGQARNTNERILNQRTVNLRSAHKAYVTNKATLENESGPSTRDDSQETNNEFKKPAIDLLVRNTTATPATNSTQTRDLRFVM